MEEFLEEKFKLLVGACIALFGSDSLGVESDEKEDSFGSVWDGMDFQTQVTDGASSLASKL